jgi:hypothetical protein
MPRHQILTFLTDFGTSDPYVAEMKGVILSVLPGANLVDISHDIPAGDVMAAAVVLRQALPYFPPETVHCVVVDPGVGTERRILAARYDRQVVVFPDNGVISFVDRDRALEGIAVVRDERYFLTPAAAPTFHGRDIIAPVAAHLAGGLGLERLGPPPETFKLLDLPVPRPAPDGRLVGQVIYVDRYGNLISNISAALLERTFGRGPRVSVACAGKEVGPLRLTYAHVRQGQVLALVNSMSLVEVAVNGGRADEALSAGVGSEVCAACQVK